MAACDQCDARCCLSFTLEVIQPQLTTIQFNDYVDRVRRTIGVKVSDIRPDAKYFKLTIDSPCRDLVGGKCGDYEHRPLTCRLYECERMKV